jgi:hypothetical protein
VIRVSQIFGFLATIIFRGILFLQMPTEEKNERYGLSFNPKWSRLDQELYCFRIAHPIEKGGLGQAEHFWKVVEMIWGPKNVVRNKTKIFIRNPWSEDMVEELCNYKYVAFGGGGGTTKSETAGLWLLVKYLANARKILGGVLSTSIPAAKRRIWGSMTDLVRAVPALPLKVMASLNVIRYVSPTFVSSDKSSLALIAAERSQEREAVGKLIGMHNEEVIIVGDELSELTDAILEYALPGGNLTTNPKFQFIGLANPPGYFDPFARLWKPKAGWGSINVESYRWESEHGVSMHFDAMKSPNILAGKTLYPFLPSAEQVEAAKKAEGGEHSLRFWRMIRGFPSPAGAEDLIYTQADIVLHEGDGPVVWDERPKIRCAGLDPGFTNGGDRSIATFATVGYTTKGLLTLCYDEQIELVSDVRILDTENQSIQICKRFKEECEKRDISIVNTACDSTGAGQPFCDVMDIVWGRGMLRVNFGGKASDRPVSFTDSTPANKRYYDRVTEIWYSGKEYLRAGQLKGIPSQMATEMCLRNYGTTGADKLIYAETKKKMKFLIQRSPDYADSGFVVLDLARQRLGFAPKAPEELQQGKKFVSATGWSSLRKRLGARPNVTRNLKPTWFRG